ncbi:MAG: glycosyltransferase [Deltaproteobacteria bacterium]|nr:glycosyltransferase [Deltaproteobacteria bacterium]
MGLFDFTISGYTTSHNCIEMNYPYQECINSLLQFCDEVVVVDSGSTDGSIEALQKIARQESRLKVFVEPVDFTHPRWAIMNDGLLKRKAREKCSAQFCWQTDMDEIVPEECIPNIAKLPQLMGDAPLIMLPMVEFWGSFQQIRGDFFTWKLRFSKNDKRIIHGIPKEHKLLDADGNPYVRAYYSDSCNYIWSDTESDIPYVCPLPVSSEQISKMSDSEYDQMFAFCLDQLPHVLHVSWLDMRRKINHYKKFWQKFHQSMYNLNIEDNAQTNVMFDKPWSEVTDTEIEERAKQLVAIGPRSFHHKLDPNVKGRMVPYTRAIPHALKSWAKRTIEPLEKQETKIQVLSSEPLVSAIIPSYNKAEFLRESIGSIIAQDYPNIEILVVNDGSPDNTEQVVSELKRENTHRPITHLLKENGGISDARNFGISRARGEYVVALDGDDIAEPSFVSKAYQGMKGGKANLSCCDVQVFGAENKHWSPNEYDVLGIRYENTIPTLVMYEKALWEKAGGYRVAFPIVEDWDFFLRCSAHSLKLNRIREPLFRYRATDSGLASIFEDKHNEVQSMIMIANADLYPVSEIMWAHEILATQIPDGFRAKFLEHDKKHPEEWLLKFWLGLSEEKLGNFNEALNYYAAAAEFTDYKEWQAVYRIGLIFMRGGKVQEAEKYLTTVRIYRPDMLSVIKSLYDQLEGSHLRA